MRSLILFTMLGSAPLDIASAQSNDASISVPGATIQIEFQADIEAHTARALINWVDDVADQLAMTYGRFPVAAPRVLIIPATNRRRGGDSPVPFGRVTRQDDGETIELYVDVDRPIADFYADWTATHEFSHLLLPRINWRQKWISEGFASYYQNVLMARAGHYTVDKAARMLTEGFDRGRASRPELSPNQAAEEGVRLARYKIYWSGAAIAMLADLQLRERSGGKKSLDTAQALSNPLLREQILRVRTSPH